MYPSRLLAAINNTELTFAAGVPCFCSSRCINRDGHCLALFIAEALLPFLAAAGLNSTEFPRQTSLTPSPEAVRGSASTIFVTATDKSGHPIVDLKPQDFVIRENGKPVRVISAVPSVSVPVMMGIMVDFSGSSMGQENRRANMATLAHFFERNIHDPDGAFLVAFGMSTFQLTGVTLKYSRIQCGHQRPTGRPADRCDSSV